MISAIRFGAGIPVNQGQPFVSTSKPAFGQNTSPAISSNPLSRFRPLLFLAALGLSVVIPPQTAMSKEATHPWPSAAGTESMTVQPNNVTTLDMAALYPNPTELTQKLEAGDDLTRFQALLADPSTNNKIVIADLYADWCGPCRAIAPKLNELAEAHPDNTKIFKVRVSDMEQNKLAPNVAREYDLRGYPTLVFFRDGQPLFQVVGYFREYTVPFLTDVIAAAEAGQLNNQNEYKAFQDSWKNES